MASIAFQTMRPRHNGRYDAGSIVKIIILHEIKFIVFLFQISLLFVIMCPVNNTPSLVQMIAWRHVGCNGLPQTNLN